MNETIKMIIDAILPNVLKIIITIISLIVARYVIPCIKDDLIPFIKEKHLYNTVKKFVQAVEKMAESGALPKVDKKAKVIELLKSKGVVVDSAIEAFIESAVKELDIIASTIYDEIVIDAEGEIEEESEKPEEPEIIIETDNL